MQKNYLKLIINETERYYYLQPIRTMITEFLLFLSSMLGITWSLVFLISGLFGISIYKVSGQKMQAFLKEVKVASIWNNDEPEGWLLGYWYIGYIHRSQGTRGDTTSELLILCRKKFYNINVAKTDDEDADADNQPLLRKPKKITFYEREGNAYYHLYYVQRQITCTTLDARKYQQDIVVRLHHEFLQRSYVVALLYGEPGKGKSMIPYFLGKYMMENPENTFQKYKKVSLVDTFNPSQPGEKFSSLYTKVSPTKESPLIVVIEEVDIMMMKIHTNTVATHRDIPTSITNKIEWNMFLDRFDRELYPHVFFIMTTNKSTQYFDELDPSYMRPGRVNVKCEV
jgi:hypothetical protein